MQWSNFFSPDTDSDTSNQVLCWYRVLIWCFCPFPRFKICGTCVKLISFVFMCSKVTLKTHSLWLNECNLFPKQIMIMILTKKVYLMWIGHVTAQNWSAEGQCWCHYWFGYQMISRSSVHCLYRWLRRTVHNQQMKLMFSFSVPAKTCLLSQNLVVGQLCFHSKNKSHQIPLGNNQTETAWTGLPRPGCLVRTRVWLTAFTATQTNWTKWANTPEIVWVFSSAHEFQS